MEKVVVNNFKKDIHYEEFISLYKKAFPSNERIPLFSINKCVRKKIFTLTKYLIDGNFVGFTIIVNNPHNKYFFFFAVDEKYRNQGLGKEILSYLFSLYKDQTIYLQAEYYPKNTPAEDFRVRRVEYYKRNNFVILPYIMTEYGVDYFIMTSKDIINYKEHIHMMKKVLGLFTFYLIYKVKVKKMTNN